MGNIMAGVFRLISHHSLSLDCCSDNKQPLQ